MTGTVGGGGLVGGTCGGMMKVGVGDRKRVAVLVGGGPKVGNWVLGKTVIGRAVMLGMTPPSGVLLGLAVGAPGTAVVSVTIGVGVRCCGAGPHRKMPTQ